MTFAELSPPIIPPWPLRSGLEAAARALFEPDDRSHVDFSRPVGEAALVAPNSVSWRVFKNPLSLFVGGVTAVIMELAEPRVRTGVWEHTTFRTDPVRRLRFRARIARARQARGGKHRLASARCRSRGRLGHAAPLRRGLHRYVRAARNPA